MRVEGVRRSMWGCMMLMKRFWEGGGRMSSFEMFGMLFVLGGRRVSVGLGGSLLVRFGRG